MKIVSLIALLAVIAYGSWYSYIITNAVFTYQCKIYDGSGFDDEQREICKKYLEGGLLNVIL